MFRECGCMLITLVALGQPGHSFHAPSRAYATRPWRHLAASADEFSSDVQSYLDPKTKTKDVIPDVVPIVGEPQAVFTGKNYTIDSILKELAAIQQQGPKSYCILGTRHCSFLHQQIIELLAYALVLSGNHVYTSGAGGTNAAAIRGALRAGAPDLLTVVLPQSISKQPAESQKLLAKVKNVVEMSQNDGLGLDMASRLCNSDLLSRAEQLIAFAFHNSRTVIEATKEAQSRDMVVTVLYLD
uniref:DNA recombination-mediator protein A n=1 Tax=Pinguiococcus pyrenoidosus TaxID=172671 RepID=A0A7R9YDI6_9STRA|mmetsp:Transcript_472/g.1725  ORF Transcript_472/g.1725 Transcript_472/m.1725 type:complete len:242 (+) Transcript_472:73-798(+)